MYKRQELINLLDVEKSLVYFSTSLKSDETTLEKLMRGKYIKLYEDDQDLLEDVLIEIKQSIEMSSIYLNILSGTMDAFASVISNNLNIVMKAVSYTHLDVYKRQCPHRRASPRSPDREWEAARRKSGRFPRRPREPRPPDCSGF